jgi:hypothetical protein
VADETLRWRLLLRDGVSPGAKRARDSLRAYRAELTRLQRTAARDAARAQRDAARQAAANARRAQENTRLLAQGTRTGLGLLGGLAVGAASALAGVVGSFAEVGAAAARSVVEIASFRESSLTALEAVLGSSQAAGRQFRNAITIANQTPLDTQDIIQQTAGFAIAGFAEREIQPLIAASADLGAAFGQRSQEGFSFALSQIRAAGQLQGQELLQLQNANVSREAVLASIARQMGLGQGEAGNRAALEAIRQRRVNSSVGIQAALDAVQTRLDRGRALGSFARDQANTLTGALSNARNAIFNLIVGMDLGNLPGIRTFKDTLIAVTNALIAGGPAAGQLQGAIAGAANAAGGLFGRLFSVQNIVGAFGLVGRAVQSIARFATAAWPVVRAFVSALGPGFMAGIAPLRGLFGSLLSGGPPSARTLALIATAARGIGSALGFAAGAVVTFTAGMGLVVGTITALWGTIGGLVAAGITSVRAMFTSVGTNIVDGIIAGITGGVGRLGAAVSGLGTSAVQSARAALGIASPSRVFADVIGRQIPAGIELGIARGSGPLDATVAGIVDPRPPRGGLGGGASISVQIIVQRGAGDEDTARTIGDHLEERLVDIFGGMAEQLG